MHESPPEGKPSTLSGIDSIQNFDAIPDFDSAPSSDTDDYCDMPMVDVKPTFTVAIDSRLDVRGEVQPANPFTRVFHLKDIDKLMHKERLVYEDLMRLIIQAISHESSQAILPPQHGSGINSLAHTLSYLLPPWAREEWVGDFREDISFLTESETSRWKIWLVAIGKFLILLLALTRVRIQDIAAPRQKKTPE